MIRAFVSSTYVDLKEHRAYVIGRLTAAGMFVDAMEKWTAASDEPQRSFPWRGWRMAIRAFCS